MPGDQNVLMEMVQGHGAKNTQAPEHHGDEEEVVARRIPRVNLEAERAKSIGVIPNFKRKDAPGTPPRRATALKMVPSMPSAPIAKSPMHAYLKPNKRRGSMSMMEDTTLSIDTQLKTVHGVINKSAFQRCAHMRKRRVSTRAHAHQNQKNQRKMLFEREALRFDSDIISQLKRLALNADFDGDNEIDEDEFKTFFKSLFNVCRVLCPGAYKKMIEENKGRDFDPMENWRNEFKSCLLLGQTENRTLSISEFKLFAMKFVGQWTHYTKPEVMAFLQNTIVVLQRANVAKERQLEEKEEAPEGGSKSKDEDPSPITHVEVEIPRGAPSVFESVAEDEKEEENESDPLPPPPPRCIGLQRPVVLRHLPTPTPEAEEEELITFELARYEAKSPPPKAPQPPQPAAVQLPPPSPPPEEEEVGQLAKELNDFAPQKVTPPPTPPPQPGTSYPPPVQRVERKSMATAPKPLRYQSARVFSRYTADGRVLTINRPAPSNTCALHWTQEVDTIFCAANEICSHARDGGRTGVKNQSTERRALAHSQSSSSTQSYSSAYSQSRPLDTYPYSSRQQLVPKSLLEQHAQQLLQRHKSLRKARSVQSMGRWLMAAPGQLSAGILFPSELQHL
jgi:hypothetical protein